MFILNEMQMLLLHQELALIDEKYRGSSCVAIAPLEKKQFNLRIAKLKFKLDLLESIATQASPSQRKNAREDAEICFLRCLKEKTLHYKRKVINLPPSFSETIDPKKPRHQ
jgi:hypothetical protein